MKPENKFQSCSCEAKFTFLLEQNSISSLDLCLMSVYAWVWSIQQECYVPTAVKHCQSSHMRSDSVVKEQKKGAICSLNTLECVGEQHYLFSVFWQSIFINKPLIFAGVMIVFIRQVSLWWLPRWHKLHVLRAPNGFHACSWNPQWDPRGISLSLLVYKLLPVLTVPGVWEETITASLHSQIILQPLYALWG